ncbi:hypothetical protein AWW72_10170 [Acinetobacter sp. NRRL B-65365]|uniref:phage tail fiber protein n=1 Tax=Acinetobacter sp. NRRL B-65365 TaxID=1785092 RepID=UPI0007A0A919|nr:hypothetical protein [Acinetobacter sp. NRRL B-65365]KYQ84258.1 hypothetical protein AWW72_10170 [Acinetobacter sp. NRRL B-65365]
MANLIFKFNWDHRPFPYNTGQGKRQFTLPFASGIPNLTPDISQVQGAGTAAKANLGAEGNNVPVAKDAFKAAHFNPVDVYWSGTGANPPPSPFADLNEVPTGTRVLLPRTIGDIANRPTGLQASLFYLETKGTFSTGGGRLQIAYSYGSFSDFAVRTAASDNNYTPWRYCVTAASPIIIGTAASGDLTNSNRDSTQGRVLRVGDFGLGGNALNFGGAYATTIAVDNDQQCGFISKGSTAAVGYGGGWGVKVGNSYRAMYIGSTSSLTHSRRALIVSIPNTTLSPDEQVAAAQVMEILHSMNTQTDSNGFIKAASPVVDLYAESIEPNSEAKEQDIKFFRNDVGCYLLQGTTGFAEEGWYIEVPKDAKGNILVSVEYETLENGDISIKTYKKKFDFETASIVSDLDNPMDIPEGRFISIRLNSLPAPEYEPDLDNEPEFDPADTKPPVEFQPTNLAQAVAAAMEGLEPPEIQNEPSNESL